MSKEMSTILSIETIHRLLAEIRDCNAIAGRSFYEAGIRWQALKKGKAHRAFGLSWWDFIHSETIGYSVSYVDFCIAIVEKFSRAIGETPNKKEIPFTRLRDALPYVKTDTEAEEWLEKANTLSLQGWTDTLRVAKGQMPQDACLHTKIEIWHRCAKKECGKWLGKEG